MEETDMAKFYGKVGYAKTVVTKLCVWKPEIIAREYFGDLTRNIRQYESAEFYQYDKFSIK